MDRLASYADSDSSDAGEAPAPTTLSAKKMIVNCAPGVHTDTITRDHIVNIDATEIKYNAKVEELYAPIVGPLNPNEQVGLMRNQTQRGCNHFSGHVEDYAVNDFSFDKQYHDFVNKGRAANPDGEMFGEVVRTHVAKPILEVEHLKEPEKKRRLKRGRADDIEGFKGPWAGYENEEIVEVELTEEQKAQQEKILKRVKEDKEKKYEEDTTTFHPKKLADYQVKSWVAPPLGTKADANEGMQCYLPKKWIHTWTGHTMGVSSIRFFPGTAHLLLSAGLDNRIKVWDVHNSRQCMRTYMGHVQGVKEANFNNDGTKFITCSYDKKLKVWDTETGACLGTFSNNTVANTVKFNPDSDKQDIFVAGCSDKKIHQWDIRANEIVQTYEYHLGAVNSITFCDENRRFISTSDDKKILIWEWGIPVVMKHISEPHMHSCPVVRMHPNQNFALMQSMDNQIVTYSTKDRFKLNRKKRFAGHINAAFACELGVSPDGKFVYSGDGDGNMIFWDWKTTRIVKKLKCHDRVTIGCIWNPQETSKMATCSWDGTIKYWD